MKTIVFAYHNIGCAGIRALRQHGYKVQAVFTHPDNPGENTWFDSVAELCATRSIPTFAPDEINHPLWIQRIRDYQPDIIFSFYYRKILGRAILRIPQAGCLNLHGSLLPRYRGRCPVNWVLVNGETETGVSLHYMTEKPDAGDIVAQRKITIKQCDTAMSLHTKILDNSIQLLDHILPAIKNGSVPRKPQNHVQATYFSARKPADGLINPEFSI